MRDIKSSIISRQFLHFTPARPYVTEEKSEMHQYVTVDFNLHYSLVLLERKIYCHVGKSIVWTYNVTVDLQPTDAFLIVWQSPNMAERVRKYDLGSLLLENKSVSVDIDAILRGCEMKATAAISQVKPWNPFAKGVHARDLSAELLIPKHKWQFGELRALK